jgi:hypothetical protein
MNKGKKAMINKKVDANNATTIPVEKEIMKKQISLAKNSLLLLREADTTKNSFFSQPLSPSNEQANNGNNLAVPKSDKNVLGAKKNGPHKNPLLQSPKKNINNVTTANNSKKEAPSIRGNDPTKSMIHKKALLSPQNISSNRLINHNNTNAHSLKSPTGESRPNVKLYDKLKQLTGNYSGSTLANSGYTKDSGFTNGVVSKDGKDDDEEKGNTGIKDRENSSRRDKTLPLDGELKAMKKKVQTLFEASLKREKELRGDNRKLRAEIVKLQTRIKLLEGNASEG